MPYVVPDVAGVPAIDFAVGFVLPTLLTADDLTGYFSGLFGPQWGVFLDGFPIVDAVSVVGVDYKQEWSICNFPVEEGGFATYNKVQLPYMPRVRFASGGSVEFRQALLDSIAAIAGDLNLYDVVTPEATYSNVNIAHYDYQRVYDRGRGLLVVDVWLQEIRPAGDASATDFSDTSNPSGADPTNGGQLQSPQGDAGTAPSAADIG